MADHSRNCFNSLHCGCGPQRSDSLLLPFGFDLYVFDCIFKAPVNDFVRQGAWRSILEAIKGQQIADQEQLLCQAAYYTLALIKLRNYTAANAELLKLGDLNAAHLTKTADDGGTLQAVKIGCDHTASLTAIL